jgi:D-arabinan exo alpha-(1,3)/(1,5)-arabinofuranosidase (non-reducing end)
VLEAGDPLAMARVTNGRSRSISAENPTGAKGGGGREASALGAGRKGRPCVTLRPGESAVLADITGPGVIRHLWLTVADQTDRNHFVLRNLVLRMWWDGEPESSVEAPLGDFFCSGFGQRATVTSLPITVAPTGGMNCYFAMPFASRARIEVASEHPAEIEGLFYQVDYELLDELPADLGRFHAQFRRTNPTTRAVDHVVLDGVRGRGQYVGTYIGVAALERYWWGEGEVKFFIDGDSGSPTICGTGLEDYVGGAWAFQDRMGGEPHPMTYSAPYFGYPYHATVDDSRFTAYARSMPPMHGLYRWHLPDPIRFASDLRVTLQQIGHEGLELFERSDDVSTVAYWYQLEPHATFPAFPAADARRPR